MNKDDPLTRRHVSIRGRVQGVGYRWFARETAESLGVTGWARNLDDGTVEVEVEGKTSALDEFIRRLRDGNPSAKVASIDQHDVEPQGGNSFEIRR